MKSKQKLEWVATQLVKYCDLQEWEVHDELEDIEKDLQVLALLKRYIKYTSQRYGAFSLGWNDMVFSDKEYNLLKEWLENDK